MRITSCLLVEDDPEDQELMIDALHNISSSLGCYAVSNGEDAIFALQHQDFRPDVILTDVNMPRMNGFEFLKNIRSMDKFRGIPVIVFSSDSSEEQIQKARQLGATAFYPKSKFNDLQDILSRHLTEISAKRTPL